MRPSACLAALLATGAPSLPAMADALIVGEVEATVTGDSFVIGGRRYRLWGIDASDLDQPCVNGDARAYACGTTAKILLTAITLKRPLACSVEGPPSEGVAPVSCRLGGYDLGGLMVAGGYAFDDPAASGGAYAQAERDAQTERAGMWGGPFVKPADWRRSRQGIR